MSEQQSCENSHTTILLLEEGKHSDVTISSTIKVNEEKLCDESSKHSVKEVANVTNINSNFEQHIDVSSELFDPLRALYSPELCISKKPPTTQFQNVAAFESSLKRYGVWGMQKKKSDVTLNAASSSKTKDELESKRRFLPHQMPIKALPGSGVKQRHNKNLWKAIDKMEGPLKMLSECLHMKRRIHVILRNEHGTRGYVDGNLICFDKHWNLVLTDVEEIWRRRKFKYGDNKICEAGIEIQECCERLKELGITLPIQTVKSLNRKNVQITRSLEQLFIRGEQIVLISVLPNKV